MKQNLEGLKAEIEHALGDAEIAIFYGHARAVDDDKTAYWDCHEHPDYNEYIQAAKAAGVKLIVLHQRTFTAEEADEALEQLEDSQIPRDDQRDFERRLKATRAYAGFVCEIELSFDREGCTYLFHLRTDWYDELGDILEEIHMLASPGEDDGQTPLGGYFSKN